MTRSVIALPLALLAYAAPASAANPIPATSTVDELTHEVSLEVGPAGATLEITRELHNPGGFPAKVDLPIGLPCETSLDAVSLELEAGAETITLPAQIVDAAEGDSRWQNFYTRPPASGEQLEAAMQDPDTALLMTRNDYSCSAELNLFPLPAFASRTIHYRVFVPATYADGRYSVELPTLADYGRPATIVLAGHDRDYVLDIDGDPALPDHVLDGAASHMLSLTARDAGQARTVSADFDIEAMLQARPSALALDAEDADSEDGPRSHLVSATFEAPPALADLPPVRRVVIVLDRSRSIEDGDRQALVRTAKSYLDQLQARAEGQPGGPETGVEILTFTRDSEPVYHDFVPLRWAAEDIERLTLADGNGSNVDSALAHARRLFERPSDQSGADWVIMLSDLRYRSNFDYEAQARFAEQNPNIHLHVVGLDGSVDSFEPADAIDPWTPIANAAGGMAWDLSPTYWDPEALAAELIEPQTIWNFGLKLALDGQAEPHEIADRTHQGRGQSYTYESYLDESGALTRATFHGEVWGQTRAWSTTPDADQARRVAAAIATSDSGHDDAVRAVLAHYAQVVSPFTSAFASVEREGSSPRPLIQHGCGGSFGSSFGCSTGCGGVSSCHAARAPRTQLDTLAQAVLDSCPRDRQGEFVLETTDDEIVAVTASSTCVSEQSWALDVTPAQLHGHRAFTLHYVAGQIAKVDERGV